MNVFEIGPATGLAALRALKTVAVADGKEADLERRLLAIAAELYGQGGVDLAGLEPITPDALAAAVSSDAERTRVIQACLLMGLADGEAERSESETIRAFARALGVSESRLTVFEKLAVGSRTRARVDFVRHSMLPSMKSVVERQGLAWMLKFMLLRVAADREDHALADRYRRLGLLPDATLGRQYWIHMRENGFALPGEIGGAPEFAVQHDITHVLTGYATDPRGEMQIAAFTAGMKKADPFTFCFFPLLQFHLGVQIQPVVAPAAGNFEPEKFARAHARGARMQIDLTDGWDHWPSMTRPIDDVRRELGIEG